MLLPLLHRYQSQKVRLVFLLPTVVLICALVGVHTGLLLSVDMVVVLECLDRWRDTRGQTTGAVLNVLTPAAFLFLGLILVFAYNDVIAAAVGNFLPHELWLNHLDSLLLDGVTVSEMARRAFAFLGARGFRFLNFVYFEMFEQIGVGLILTALCLGRRASMRFVGTILVAYYLALFCFWLLPATGPYFIRQGRLPAFPTSLSVYRVQVGTIANLSALWHGRKQLIGLDYFIAFPCMHIAQPLIVAWFLRRWKRIVAILLAYDVVLLAAILLLEQHYVVDLLGGVAVGIVAILLIGDRVSGPVRLDEAKVEAEKRPAELVAQ